MEMNTGKQINRVLMICICIGISSCYSGATEREQPNYVKVVTDGKNDSNDTDKQQPKETNPDSSDSNPDSGNSEKEQPATEKEMPSTEKDTPPSDKAPETAPTAPGTDSVAYYLISTQDSGICYDYRFDKSAESDLTKIGSTKLGSCPKDFKVKDETASVLKTCIYQRLEKKSAFIRVLIYSAGELDGVPYKVTAAEADEMCVKWAAGKAPK